MLNENVPNLPPVLEETMSRIETMSKKDLKELATSLLFNLADLVEKHAELQQQCTRQSQQYLSQCRSSGGVTLPPNFR